MTPLTRLFWLRDNYFLSQDLRNDTKKSWVAYKLVFKNYLKISDFEWLIFWKSVQLKIPGILNIPDVLMFTPCWNAVWGLRIKPQKSLNPVFSLCLAISAELGPFWRNLFFPLEVPPAPARDLISSRERVSLNPTFKKYLNALRISLRGKSKFFKEQIRF